MSDTPRTDAYEAEYNAWCRYAEQHKNIPEALDQCPLEDDPIGMMRKFERELAEMKAKYAAECDASMMAGSQNSALRLQLWDAEERSRARSANEFGWRYLDASHDLPEGPPADPGTTLYAFDGSNGHWEYNLPPLPERT